MKSAGTRRSYGIASLPCGRRTKYLVVVFWLVVVAVTGGLAGKLQGAEKNDASAYLPASAESTQELNLQSKFVSKNLNPAVVVYVRSSGITPVDLRKAAADARSFGALPAVIIVRSVLVTALTLDIGRWMWWPSGLARQPAGDDRITPVSATALR